MKKRLGILLITLLIVGLTVSPTLAANGARAEGMGGAFTAVADDPSAVFHNPAGLYQSGIFGLQLDLNSNLEDVKKIGDIAEIFNAENKQQAIIEASDTEGMNVELQSMGAMHIKGFGLGANVESEFHNFSQSAINNNYLEGAVSLGKQFVDMPLGLGDLALGVNLKGIYAKTTKIDKTSYEEYSSTGKGYGVDIGALVKATDLVNIGINAKNVVSNISWDNDIPNHEQSTKRPRVVSLGVASKLPFPISATIAGDVDILEGGTKYYRAGIEKSLLIFDVRLGGYKGSYENAEAVYTGGIGLDLPFVRLDIAGNTNEDFNVTGTFEF